MSPVLKIERDDEEQELAFELAYQRTLTTQQRFELMFRKSREIAEMLLRHGYLDFEQIYDLIFNN